MNTTNIMKDPTFTPILFQIESRILRCSRAAKSDGIVLNDSQIRSTLNKVRKTSEGGKPQIPNTSPRDLMLAGLHDEILNLGSSFMMDDRDGNPKPLPTHVWTLCIRTIEDSIQRYSTGPGSQGYQDFLEVFIPKKA